MPFGFRVRADVRDIRQTDRQTDGRTTDADHRIMPPRRGHNKVLCSRYCAVEANYRQTRSNARPVCDSRATSMADGLLARIPLPNQRVTIHQTKPSSLRVRRKCTDLSYIDDRTILVSPANFTSVRDGSNARRRRISQRRVWSCRRRSCGTRAPCRRCAVRRRTSCPSS